MDYYLVGNDLLVEEFAFGEDGAAVGLWSSAPDLSRAIRSGESARPLTSVEAEAFPLSASREYLPFPSASALSFGGEPLWRIIFAGTLADAPAGRIIASGSRDGASWDVRRIGDGIAWCIDIKGVYDVALVQELKEVMRFQGLIPVTIERLG